MTETHPVLDLLGLEKLEFLDLSEFVTIESVASLHCRMEETYPRLKEFYTYFCGAVEHNYEDGYGATSSGTFRIPEGDWYYYDSNDTLHTVSGPVIEAVRF